MKKFTGSGHSQHFQRNFNTALCWRKVRNAKHFCVTLDYRIFCTQKSLSATKTNHVLYQYATAVLASGCTDSEILQNKNIKFRKKSLEKVVYFVINSLEKISFMAYTIL